MAIVKFGVVSGIGWLIDFGIMATLTHALGVRPLWANIAGASVAVTFVFFTSIYRVFIAEHRFLIGKFLVYCLYQVAAVSAASWLIDYLTLRLEIDPVLAKVLVTPATFYANFLFMAWLVTGKVRLR